MWAKLDLDEVITKHTEMDRALHDDPVIRDIHRVYTSIDEKSAALIGHVSLMIAACTFLAASSTEQSRRLFQRLFLGEALIYLLVAGTLLLVLNLSMFGAPSGTEEMRRYFARSSRRRFVIHSACLALTIVLTLCVVLTVLYEWFS